MPYQKVFLFPLIRLVAADYPVWAEVQALACSQHFCHMAGVGSVNNTFGIKGVAESTFFFKSIDDANRLRRQVSECFERAALPQASQQVCSEHSPELPARHEVDLAAAPCMQVANLICSKPCLLSSLRRGRSQ